jgi:hypothetical protein
VVVVAVIAIVTPKAPPPQLITDPFDPSQRYEHAPPAPTPEQREEYNKLVEENPLTQAEREILERHREFSLDNDTPTGQRIVRLQVKCPQTGVMQSVYDEDGNEVFVNRRSRVIGNFNFAMISRRTLLVIRFDPATMGLADVVGNRYTVNADNKVMNMDGVQPYSPRSLDDITRKLSDMGYYTSSIDPSRMLLRMDDCNLLMRAMHQRQNNISVGFFGTIGNAFRNVFGGNSGNRNGWQTFLDVLVIIGVIIGGIIAVIIFIVIALVFTKLIRKFAKT